MSSNYLIELLSEFDINIKYLKVKINNQLNRNYGHFYLFLCFVSLSLLLFNTFILVFISDDDIDSLKMFGSFGFKLVGKRSRFIIDTGAIAYYICIFLIQINYLFDKMQWLLKMSSIYEEIRTKHFDTFLVNLSKNLSFYYNLGSILAIILSDLIQFFVIYFKWDEIVDYPVAFIIYSLFFNLQPELVTGL